jgi:hypothetical protein
MPLKESEDFIGSFEPERCDCPADIYIALARLRYPDRIRDRGECLLGWTISAAHLDGLFRVELWTNSLDATSFRYSATLNQTSLVSLAASD